MNSPRRSLALGCSAWLLCGFLFVANGAAAQGTNVELATTAEKQSATTDYRAGMKAFDGKNHAAALELFKKSYDTVASPNSGLMIARSLIQLGRLSEAYLELERVSQLANALARGNAKYKTTADAAQKELGELKAKLALLTVSVPVSVSVNDVVLPSDQWNKPVPVAAGATTLRLRAGDQTTERRLSLPMGSSQSLALDLPKQEQPAPSPAAPPPQKSGPGRTLGYVALGLGAVGLGVSTVLLVVNQGRLSEIEDNCRGGTCPANVVDDVDSSRSGETLALIGLGVGVVGVGVGTYLVLSSSTGAARAATLPRTAVRIGISSVQLSTQF